MSPLVGISFVAFGRQVAHAGSVYAYVGAVLGSRCGFVAGWALMLMYVTLLAGSTALVGNFGADALAYARIEGRRLWLIVAVLGAFIAVWLTWRDMRLVARHAALRPTDAGIGGPFRAGDFARDEGNYHRQTTYSMFGTARAVESFELNIQSATEEEPEGCTAWGCPSYTTDIDFRNETSDDCLVFTLTVRPEMFARYVAQVEQGFVDEMILRVGWVDGFYSDWSPSISTRDVKILTSQKEHKVTLPPDHQFEPPRLGYVGGMCAVYQQTP